MDDPTAFDGTEIGSGRLDSTANENIAANPDVAKHREVIDPIQERELLNADPDLRTKEFRALPEVVQKTQRSMTMLRMRVLAQCYDPTSTERTIENARKLGYSFNKNHVMRYAKNPYFIQLWQDTIRPLVAGNIAKIADVQAAVTNVLISPQSTNLERLKAAELMGKFLHAFDPTIKVEGTLQAIIGVVTGVPSSDSEGRINGVEQVIRDAAINVTPTEVKK